VIYRENHLIAGAADFVQALSSTGTPFLFLTNNSAPTPEDLAVRLKHLGVHGITAKHFYTSALNTADFLSETDPNCTVFIIGDGGIAPALHERKIANDAIRPSYVVVGEGAVTATRHDEVGALLFLQFRRRIRRILRPSGKCHLVRRDQFLLGATQLVECFGVIDFS
jgi:ribonucleotide monophosphatase NagD (HAD superfamily)